MAVNMKFGRCPAHTNMLIMTLFVLNLFILQVRVQGSTTPPAGPLTTGAATTPATTAAPVPTTAQAQTTTPTPGGTTAAPSPIPENTDISPCPCDLTGNACDINCCCDGDCSANDKKSFSHCLKYSYQIDDTLCFKKELILKENSPYTSTINSANLFCISVDNRPQRNFYNNPDLVENNDTFEKYVRQYGSFSFQHDVPKTTTTYADFYRSGDMIYTVFPSQSMGTLGLPKALSSPYCTDGNPAAYLYSQFHECVRQLTDLANTCSSMPALDASTYYLNFRVVSVPALFQRYTPFVNDSGNATDKTPTGPQSAVDLTEVLDLYNNTYTIPITLDVVLCKDASGVTSPCPISPPTLNSSGTVTVCDNVVVNVTYKVVYNGTKGIISMSAQVVLASISVSTQNLAQTFATVFTAEGAPPIPFQRSGNPGYVQGQPIMAGGKNKSIDPNGKPKEEILLNTNRNRWLTLVRSTPGGGCITDMNQDRVSVTFKDDVRSGCIMNISQTTLSCTRMQQVIISALEGEFPTTDPYVAIFGNSDVKQVGDWIPIYVPYRPVASGGQTATCFLSLGMHVQVLYANVGSLVNPQPKIIGISFLYDPVQAVNYKCEGPYCLSGTEGLVQQIEISTSASFIDVSQPAVPYEAERPIFVAKVPYDFFYPFLSNAPARSQSYLILFMCSVSAMLVSVLSPMLSHL